MTDDDDSLDSTLKSVQKEIFQKVFFLVLASALGLGSYIGLGGARPDPFTGTDGRALERRIDAIEGRIGVIEYRLQIKHQAIEKLQECCRDMNK